MNKKIIAILVVVAIAVAGIVGIGVGVTKNRGKTQNTISREEALSDLDRLMKKIDLEEGTPQKSAIESFSTNVADELPDIEKTYPKTVDGNGDIDVEIITSTEKGGTGTDGWLNDVAKSFNSQHYQVNGKTVSISVRSMATGAAVDYITSNVYVPDAYTPSNEFFGEMISASGVKINKESERLVGNTAGILVSAETVKTVTEKYGAANFETLFRATQDGIISLGYTNPYSSATGLNFLITALQTIDKDNILSDKAVTGFQAFQANVPLVAYTTLQMRESAESGVLDAFIMEYQTYANDKSLSSYTFIPFGAYHNNPLYSIGVLSADKEETIKKFVEYCGNTESQNLATKYGFNYDTNYKPSFNVPDGSTCVAAQKLWKENKDNGQEIVSVFVVDTSGSMDGEPMNALKSSLINSINYINPDSYVGLITYSSEVVKQLDIAKFDLNQKAYFKGTVENLQASGGTATYSAIAAGLKMLEDELPNHPNAKPMLFLLTDGYPQEWVKYSDVSSIIDGLNVPVYTIGYGSDADMDNLAKISSINEAASISATTDDVTYKIKNLFNAEL